MQRITYAKTKSDAVAKLDGTFQEKDKKERQKHNKAERGRHLHILTLNLSAAIISSSHMDYSTAMKRPLLDRKCMW